MTKTFGLFRDYCQARLLLGVLLCLMLAPGAVLSKERDAAQAIAAKFSAASQEHSADATVPSKRNVVRGNSLDPEILSRIHAIKKKADAAWAKTRRARKAGEKPSLSKKRSDVEATNDAGEKEHAKRREANRKQGEASRHKAEQARQAALKKEAKEKAAKAAKVARVKARQEKARQAERARQAVKERAEAKAKAQAKAKTEREAKLARIAALKKKRAAEAARKKAERKRRQAEKQRQIEAKRLADAALASEQRRREQLRLLEAERQRMEKRRRKQEARRLQSAREADEARRADDRRREKLRKELDERRKHVIEHEDTSRSLNSLMADAEKRRQLEEARQNEWQHAAELAKQTRDEEAHERDAMALQREREAEQLSAHLRSARQSRSGLGARDIEPPQSIIENDRRVTILLIMDVGNKGIRRWSKTADPMLCIRDKCYLSQGRSKPARELLRGKAFGPSVAFGIRGLSCRSHPACIFREVNLHGRTASLQPVDLKILHHDRRETRLIEADRSCTMVAGRLSCDKLFGAGSWRAWVVPEAVAEWAGPQKLQAALNSGLR